jgi:hypothetical protein
LSRSWPYGHTVASLFRFLSRFPYHMKLMMKDTLRRRERLRRTQKQRISRI